MCPYDDATSPRDPQREAQMGIYSTSPFPPQHWHRRSYFVLQVQSTFVLSQSCVATLTLATRQFLAGMCRLFVLLLLLKPTQDANDQHGL
jgi:hypothetical protein